MSAPFEKSLSTGADDGSVQFSLWNSIVSNLSNLKCKSIQLL